MSIWLAIPLILLGIISGGVGFMVWFAYYMSKNF